MPTYEYNCKICSEEEQEDITFDLMRPISQRDEQAECPVCHSLNTTRRMTAPLAIHEGMTRALKNLSGQANLKKRIEMTKYLKDERTKRQRRYGPDTEQASNQLWAGNEVKDGVIPGPRPDQQVRFAPKDMTSEQVAEHEKKKQEKIKHFAGA